MKLFAIYKSAQLYPIAATTPVWDINRVGIPMEYPQSIGITQIDLDSIKIKNGILFYNHAEIILDNIETNLGMTKEQFTITALKHILKAKINKNAVELFYSLGAEGQKEVLTHFCKSIGLIKEEEKRKDYAGGNLKGTNYRNANLVDANFSNADLAGCDFRDADLSRTNFTGANLVGALFEDTLINNTSFKGADLSMADFQHSTLIGCDLTEANLEEANMENAKLEVCNLHAVNWHNTHLNEINLVVCENTESIEEELKLRQYQDPLLMT